MKDNDLLKCYSHPHIVETEEEGKQRIAEEKATDKEWKARRRDDFTKDVLFPLLAILVIVYLISLI